MLSGGKIGSILLVASLGRAGGGGGGEVDTINNF